MIELRHVRVDSRKVSPAAAESKADDSSDLLVADEAAAGVAEACVARSIHGAGTDGRDRNRSLIRLRSVAKVHVDYVKLDAEEDRVWPGVGLRCDSPAIE